MRWGLLALGGLGGALALWAALLASGSLRAAIDPVPATPFDAPPQSPSIVVLGTSLTANYDWPAALQIRLGDCLGRNVRVLSVAGGGRTSQWGLMQVDRVLEARPDIVLIEFTANDADLRRRLSPARSLTLHEDILAQIFTAAPAARVVLIGTNPVYGVRGLARPWMQAYVRNYAELAAQDARVGFVDLGEAWKRAIAQLSRADVLPDGLHPDPDRARDLMVTHMAPIVGRLVEPGGCE